MDKPLKKTCVRVDGETVFTADFVFDKMKELSDRIDRAQDIVVVLTIVYLVTVVMLLVQW